MLGMIARNSEADVNVMALIGERGREVKEFIENSLGPEGMKKSKKNNGYTLWPSKSSEIILPVAKAELFRSG